MGRPFGISDRDIDIDLPLDINENTDESQLTNLDSILASSSKSSTLTSFIMIVQLRHIESDIQQTIYRVDKNSVPDDAVIDEFLAQLDDWKAKIPRDTRHFRDVGDEPFDGYDYYVTSPLPHLFSSQTLTCAACLLLQMPAIASLSTNLEDKRRSKILEGVRASLRWGVWCLQTASPGSSCRLLAHGASDSFHGRSDACILSVDISGGHLRLYNEQWHSRLQHRPVRHC